MLCNTNEVIWESLPTHNPPRQQCSAAQRSAVQFLVQFCFVFQLCLTKIDRPPLTLPQLPIRQILANVVPAFRHTGSQLATEDHTKHVRRIRAFSTYALTKLDYITHGAVLPAPSLTNLQVITNRHFRCVYRRPKWAPLDSQMESSQVQPNCNSKEQPSMQTQQALGGVFSHRARTARAQRAHSARTAPTITVIIRVTAPKKPPTRGIMHNQFKSRKFKHLMLAIGPVDLNSAPYSPVHCSRHSMTSAQSSELTELPVVENSQRFAQRAHSACTARAQRTVRPLATHENLQTTWALTESHRDGTGFHIHHRGGHPPEVRAARGQSWG